MTTDVLTPGAFSMGFAPVHERKRIRSVVVFR